MSFRSRARTSQPVVRHRSLSSSRAPTSGLTTSGAGGYQSPYTSSRPLSTYTSPYTSSTNPYSSRESLYSPSAVNSSTSGRSAYSFREPTSSSTQHARSSGGGSSNNPYASSSGTNGSGTSGSSYVSPYSSDRYVSPYSSYDNGVTTAGLSLSTYSSPSAYKPSAASTSAGLNGSSCYGSGSSSIRNSNLLSSSRFGTSNSNLAAALVGRSQSFKEHDRKQRDRKNEMKRNEAARSESLRVSTVSAVAPMRRSRSTARDEVALTAAAAVATAKANVVADKVDVVESPAVVEKLAAPSTSGTQPTAADAKASAPVAGAQSTATGDAPRRPARKVSRSYSVSSEKSEGYESGSERTSRSRLGSTSSMVSDGNNDLKSSDSTENGDHIDYKALYEAVKLDNDKLKQQLKKKDEDLSTAKATVDRFANATTKNSLSELEKRERRAMDRKLSEMEEELKHLEALKTENQRLKDENGALIRVISKLSK